MSIALRDERSTSSYVAIKISETTLTLSNVCRGPRTLTQIIQTIAQAIRGPAIGCKPTQIRKRIIHVPW